MEQKIGYGSVLISETLSKIIPIIEKKTGYSLNITEILGGKLTFFVNGINTICVTLTHTKNHEIDVQMHCVGGSQFVYPFISTSDQLIAALPSMLMSAEEASKRKREIWMNLA